MASEQKELRCDGTDLSGESVSGDRSWVLAEVSEMRFESAFGGISRIEGEMRGLSGDI